jgi:hypothetical protein
MLLLIPLMFSSMKTLASFSRSVFFPLGSPILAVAPPIYQHVIRKSRKMRESDQSNRLVTSSLPVQQIDQNQQIANVEAVCGRVEPCIDTSWGRVQQIRHSVAENVHPNLNLFQSFDTHLRRRIRENVLKHSSLFQF